MIDDEPQRRTSDRGWPPDRSPARPDHLDAEPAPSTRRRRRLLVAVAVVVCAGLGAVRVVQLEPDDLTLPGPQPSTETSSSVPAGGALPRGILFFTSSGSVWTLDLDGGALVRTALTIDEAGSMVSLGHGVAVVPTRARPPVVLVDGFALYPTPAFLATAQHLLPAAGDTVWVAGRQPSTRAVEWRRTSLAGQVDAKVRTTGVVVSDGAGGLLDLDLDLDGKADGKAGGKTVQRVYPSPAGPRLSGTVVATGPDGYLVRPCTRSSRTSKFVLYDHRDARPQTLRYSLPPQVLDGAALSPDNRLAAVALNEANGETRVDVRAVQDGRLLRTFSQTGRSDVVWLDRTRVVLTSRGHLLLYDTTTQAVTPLAPAVDGIGPLLIWQSS